MIHDRPMDVCMRNLWQKAERGKIIDSESTTRFPQASCFEKSMRSVPEIWGCMCVCVCVCVNSTSGGERSLATPTYQGKLTLVFLPLGAAVNKIKSATLTLPSAQERPLAHLHPTFPGGACTTYLLGVPMVQENGMRNPIPVQPRKTQRNYLVAILQKY